MKFIENIHLKNKTVIVRCDYNVPIKDNKILDDTKIVKSLKTIKYLLSKNCKVIILSHLGRIESEQDKLENSLEPIKYVLEDLLKEEVVFVPNVFESGLLLDKNIFLLENTRFYDFPKKLESANDLSLASSWAKLADVFVFDAFGSAHRLHASTGGISKYLPTAIGYLVEEELNNLEKVCKNPKTPFVVIMGGAKVDDKIPLIKALLPTCDYILLGGGIANSFLKAKGINVGESLATKDETITNELKLLMELYKDKIILPIDVCVKNNVDITHKGINQVLDNDVVFDIGPKTITKYKTKLEGAQTVFMNGTMGLYEEKAFSAGTAKILEALTTLPTVAIGGGDTVGAVNHLGFEDKFIISSGGGASLEFIAKGHLEALEEIEKNETEKISL